MGYFGNFNFKLRYCGVLRICGMGYFWRFAQRYLIKKTVLHGFRPFSGLIGFWSFWKQWKQAKRSWNSSMPSREKVKTVIVCESCQYHCDFVTIQFLCFNNNQLKVGGTDVYWHLISTFVDLWSNHALCGTMGLHSAMAEVLEKVMIDCVALFYEEVRVFPVSQGHRCTVWCILRAQQKGNLQG